MSECISEVVVRSFTLKGWKERVLEPGESIYVDKRPVRINSLRLISGLLEGQTPPPPRRNITISSFLQQEEEAAYQVTTTQESGEAFTQQSPILFLGAARRKRGLREATNSLLRHGIIAEYVGIRPRR